LLTPTSGNVEKGDYSYGVMIENPSFVEHETARQNLKFLASIQKKIGMAEIETALEKVNLLHKADVKVKKFSLGMKQRLGFCQAIMENPDVLLLDEPFNALDDEHFELVLNTILEMKKDKIVIIAAHGFDLEKYPIFDEIITMANGKVVK
jgi:ABC-2 type transport system ATP-binding protein